MVIQKYDGIVVVDGKIAVDSECCCCDNKCSMCFTASHSPRWLELFIVGVLDCSAGNCFDTNGTFVLESLGPTGQDCVWKYGPVVPVWGYLARVWLMPGGNTIWVAAGALQAGGGSMRPCFIGSSTGGACSFVRTVSNGYTCPGAYGEGGSAFTTLLNPSCYEKL